MSASDFILQNYENIFKMQPEEAPVLGEKVLIPRFPKDVISKLCDDAKTLLQNYPPLRKIDKTVVVVGDLHGNLHDLVRILLINGLPPKTNYLFLGDTVDRGDFSIEVVTLLLALHNSFIDNVTILRGNHEYPDINEKFGFKESVNAQYGDATLWEKFNEVFSYLPISAVIHQHIFCVHGGVSPRLKSLQDIEQISLPLKDCPEIVADLLWSDPVEDIAEYRPSLRGLGNDYGAEASKRFLDSIKCDTIIRGHQSVASGIQKAHNNSVITVFSSSNYGHLDNVAAYITIDPKIKENIMNPITIPSRECSMFLNVTNPSNSFSSSCGKIPIGPTFGKGAGKPILAAKRSAFSKSAVKGRVNRNSMGILS